LGGVYRGCSRVAACRRRSKSGGEGATAKGEPQTRRSRGLEEREVVEYIDGDANSMVSMRKGGTVVVGTRTAVRAPVCSILE